MKTVWSEDPDLAFSDAANAGGAEAVADAIQPPGIFTMARILRTCFRSIFPWSGPRYMEIYRSVLDVLAAVRPDICVVDPALNPALTACRAVGQHFIILAPNTIKDFALGAQPVWEQFAKYPW